MLTASALVLELAEALACADGIDVPVLSAYSAPSEQAALDRASEIRNRGARITVSFATTIVRGTS